MKNGNFVEVRFWIGRGLSVSFVVKAILAIGSFIPCHKTKPGQFSYRFCNKIRMVKYRLNRGWKNDRTQPVCYFGTNAQAFIENKSKDLGPLSDRDTLSRHSPLTWLVVTSGGHCVRAISRNPFIHILPAYFYHPSLAFSMMCFMTR